MTGALGEIVGGTATRGTAVPVIGWLVRVCPLEAVVDDVAAEATPRAVARVLAELPRD
jgi:hypothetical protein